MEKVFIDGLKTKDVIAEIYYKVRGKDFAYKLDTPVSIDAANKDFKTEYSILFGSVEENGGIYFRFEDGLKLAALNKPNVGKMYLFQVKLENGNVLKDKYSFGLFNKKRERK